MSNLQRVRNRIRALENSTSNRDIADTMQLLENLLFDDYSRGSKESTIELIVALLERQATGS